MITMDEMIGGAELAGGEVRGAAEVLSRVLEEVDQGRIEADLDHAAYLRGAVDTLAMLSGGCPRTKVSRHEPDAGTGTVFPQDG